MSQFRDIAAEVLKPLEQAADDGEHAHGHGHAHQAQQPQKAEGRAQPEGGGAVVRRAVAARLST